MEAAGGWPSFLNHPVLGRIHLPVFSENPVAGATPDIRGGHARAYFLHPSGFEHSCCDRCPGCSDRRQVYISIPHGRISCVSGFGRPPDLSCNVCAADDSKNDGYGGGIRRIAVALPADGYDFDDCIHIEACPSRRLRQLKLPLPG